MKLTTVNLEKVLDQSVKTPNWKRAMQAIHASEDLAFRWRCQSLAAQKANDMSSIFWLEWRGAFDWWHNHAGRARTENIITYEASIRDQALNGIEHVVLGPDQRPVYRENPAYIGKSDAQVMDAEFCKPGEVARYRLLLDEKGNPIPMTKVEQIPAPLRLRVLEQDPRYIAKQDVAVKVEGEITVAKPLQRLPGEERPDVERLKRLAAMTPEQRRELIGASAVPLDANGHRTIASGLPPGKRDDDLPVLEKPSPYKPYVPPASAEPPQAPPPRPSKPSTALDAGERIGRGEPPAGGFRVS
jgi:hypothetical protein